MIELKIKDVNELRVLHLTLMEAKYHENPVKKEIQGSPLVAKIVNRVVSKLSELEDTDIKNRRESDKNPWIMTWDEWRKNPSESMLVNHLIKWTKEYDNFHKLDKDCQLEYLKNLSAPYLVPDEKLLRYVNEAK